MAQRRCSTIRISYLECDGLEELLAYYDMTEDQLATRLMQIGYHYDPMSNQFKAHG
ncbi:DUF4250 domain-containing protein [Aeromonas salmonicida]|uniref:DUF4250 domain-containing protein n=1 Tax=Aeromonas salmonicida TaxID=645 RepID=UPI003D23802F